jgi:ech hydrogenase subunit E
MADGMGFESMFMNTWRIREKILDIFEKTTGGRVIFSACKVGGVRRDIEKSELDAIATILEGCVLILKILRTPSLKNRLL